MLVEAVINLAHVRPSTGLSELGMNRFGTDVPTNAWNQDKPYVHNWKWLCELALNWPKKSATTHKDIYRPWMARPGEQHTH